MDARDVLEDVRDTGDDTVVVDTHVIVDVVAVIVLVGGRAAGTLCVEMGFTWTFPRNQDASVKLKSDPISIKL